MSNDGKVNREEFVRLLGFNSWIPVKRYVELGIKYNLLKKDAIEIKMTDKNIESFWYPKSWVATIKADWAKSKAEGGRLPKPRERDGKSKVPNRAMKVTHASKAPSRASYNARSDVKTLHFTLPNEIYDFLIKKHGNEGAISRYVMDIILKTDPSWSKRQELQKKIEQGAEWLANLEKDLKEASSVEDLNRLENAQIFKALENTKTTEATGQVELPLAKV
jgi:hypothetical protein